MNRTSRISQPPRSLVVSIHDVAPSTRERVAAMLASLAQAGVARTSLLVVPDYHHQGDIAADVGFCAWLRGMAEAGHEVVQHGYRHTREPRTGEGPFTRAVTRLYTAGEGEFYDITYNDARERLERGRESILAATGAEPPGFIAPAWLLSEAGELAAERVGFRYTVRLGGVKRLDADGREHASQSLCWSVRAAWRRPVSLCWNALLSRALCGNPLLRVSVHPPDFEWPAVWGQVLRACRRAVESRDVVTYARFAAAI